MWERRIKMNETLQISTHQLYSLWGIWVFHQKAFVKCADEQMFSCHLLWFKFNSITVL